MMRDLFDAFGRDSPAAQHVRKEGTNVAATLRAAERDDENGVKHLQSSICN
jgi:hypothetical protein